MKQWLEQIKHRVDQLIPLSLILLLIILVLEIFFHDIAVQYERAITLTDYGIIAVFITDLGFKYNRVREPKPFFKKYWMEVIAVIPVFLVLRVFEQFSIITSLGERTQAALHESLAIEKESRIVIQELEKGGSKAGRLRFAVRYIKPLARSPRMLKAYSFFEHPSHKSIFD